MTNCLKGMLKPRIVIYGIVYIRYYLAGANARSDKMSGFKKDIRAGSEETHSLEQLKHEMEQSLWNLRKDLRNENRSETEKAMIKISLLSLFEEQANKLSETELSDYLADYHKRVEQLFDRCNRENKG